MAVKTKSEHFVESKTHQWKKLHNILTVISKKGFNSLSKQEVKEFPRLYRLACTDYAEAQMLDLSPDVLNYLNDIIGQAHKYIYSFPPVQKSSIKNFFVNVLPWVILKNFKFVAISAFLFITSYIITYFVVIDSPEIARAFLPEEILSMMENSYSKKNTEGRVMSQSSMMTTYYIQHNISIAFCSFAAGVLLGLGTIYFLLYNGLTLGAITGYIVSLGHGENFQNFVTAHSVFELSGLVLAGASGLLLGYSIINSGKYYRKDWLRMQRDNLFTLVAAAGILIFFAAFIEGFISPSLLPYLLKVAVAAVSLLILIYYFFILPYIQYTRKPPE